MESSAESWPGDGQNSSWICETRECRLFFPLLYLHDSTMQEPPMPSYDSFMCPNCEHHFRVIWPEPLPSYYHLCSKIKIKCPDCGEVTVLYDFLIDEIMQALEPGIPSVEVLSISPRDPNPDPHAR